MSARNSIIAAIFITVVALGTVMYLQRKKKEDNQPAPSKVQLEPGLVLPGAALHARLSAQVPYNLQQGAESEEHPQKIEGSSYYPSAQNVNPFEYHPVSLQ